MLPREGDAAEGSASPRSARTPIALAVAAKAGLLLLLAWNSRFVMDEFYQLNQANYLFNGFFDTIWPAKAVGYAVFYKPALWLGWNSASIMLIGRMQTALMGCATLVLIYAIARRMVEDQPRALLIVLVALSFSNMMERLFRTIAEPLALFFAASALVVVVRGNSPGAKRIFCAGLLSGMAFLATQKSIYFNAALGLGLVVDAGWSRHYLAAVLRGCWLFLGWAAALAAYCLVFGGLEPLPLLQNLFFGPVEVAAHGGAVYGNLEGYVLQTLVRNIIPYAACLAGMAVTLPRFGKLGSAERIALVFTVVIAALVFAHNQPWPYVFIMALPFMALWSLRTYDRIPLASPYRRAARMILIAGIALSFAMNLLYLRIDNRAQLGLMSRAEVMLSPGETYFDGTGMLPSRRESTRLWLDARNVVVTREQGQASEAYRGLRDTPPKIILWSYRMDAIEPVVGALVRASYVHVSPNIWLAGSRLASGRTGSFVAPIGRPYSLYDDTGHAIPGSIEVDGKALSVPVTLAAGPHRVKMSSDRREALLLPVGRYSGLPFTANDDPDLFADVYN